MCKLLFLTLSMTFLVACDAPVRTRVNPLNSNSVQQGGINTGTFNPGTSTGSTGSGSTTGTTNGGSNPNNGLPDGFSNCDFTDRFHTVDIGHFALCQSSINESHFILKTSLTHQSPSARVCLIPTYKDSTGSSTYIGQPQCTYTTQGQMIAGQLYKNRQGFSSYPLNGVIVMKETLLPEYLGCMHAYINWLPQACPQGPNSTQYCQYWSSLCPYGSKTNQACDTAARSYMSQVCTSFKNRYSNSYIDIRTRSN